MVKAGHHLLLCRESSPACALRVWERHKMPPRETYCWWCVGQGIFSLRLWMECVWDYLLSMSAPFWFKTKHFGTLIIGPTYIIKNSDSAFTYIFFWLQKATVSIRSWWLFVYYLLKEHQSAFFLVRQRVHRSTGKQYPNSKVQRADLNTLHSNTWSLHVCLNPPTL